MCRSGLGGTFFCAPVTLQYRGKQLPSDRAPHVPAQLNLYPRLKTDYPQLPWHMVFGGGEMVQNTQAYVHYSAHPLMQFIWAAMVTLGLAVSPAMAASDSPDKNGKPKNERIFIRSISGWNVIDNDTLILHAGPSRMYRVEVFQNCYALRHTETIAIQSRGLTVGNRAINHIIAEDQRCLVTDVERITRDELKQLKADLKARRYHRRPSEPAENKENPADSAT